MSTVREWCDKFERKYASSGQPPERFGRVMAAAARLDNVDLNGADRSDRHVPLVRCPACGQVRAADEFETVGDEVREGTDRASDAQLTEALRRQSHGTFAKRRQDDQKPVVVGQRYVDGHYETVYTTRGEQNRKARLGAIAAERVQHRMEAAGKTDGETFGRHMEEEMEKLARA